MKHLLKYHVYKYVNSSHSRLEKGLLKSIIWLVLKIARVDSVFMSLMFSEIDKDEFKLVGRRLSWLLTHSWLSLSIVEDKYFDFSIDINTQSALASYKLVKKSKRGLGVVRDITLAQLASGVVESQLQPGESKALAEIQHAEYDQFYLKHIGNAKQALVKQEVALSIVAEKNNSPFKYSANKVNLLHKHALELFELVLNHFDKRDIPLFVISGTFLGLIRDQDFISHDYDIDFGVFEEDLTQELVVSLSELEGFRPPKLDYPCFRETIDGQTIYRRLETPALAKLLHKSGMQVDLFTHYRDADVFWHGSSLHRWDNKKFDLIKREFLGFGVWSPDDHELYLTENYGDWRTPVREFNCTTGTPNIAFNPSCKSECLMLKRRLFERAE